MVHVCFSTPRIRPTPHSGEFVGSPSIFTMELHTQWKRLNKGSSMCTAGVPCTGGHEFPKHIPCNARRSGASNSPGKLSAPTLRGEKDSGKLVGRIDPLGVGRLRESSRALKHTTPTRNPVIWETSAHWVTTFCLPTGSRLQKGFHKEDLHCWWLSHTAAW